MVGLSEPDRAGPVCRTDQFGIRFGKPFPPEIAEDIQRFRIALAFCLNSEAGHDPKVIQLSYR